MSSDPHPSESHAQKLTEIINSLSTVREFVASELDALRNIYGDEAISVRQSSEDPDDAGRSLQYDVDMSLSSHENVNIKVLVSLASSYPASSPPHLQLLTRYIGAFKVSNELFGDIFRLFLSPESPVDFSPDTVAVFDGLQHAMEMCSAWYEDRLSLSKTGKSEPVLEGKVQSSLHSVPDAIASPQSSPAGVQNPSETPLAVKVFEGEPIINHKSVFIGRVCRLMHPREVAPLLAYLKADSRMAGAAHPTIYAWNCDNGRACDLSCESYYSTDGQNREIELQFSGCDDNGEKDAGGQLSNLLNELKLDEILLVVTRFGGGYLQGSDRLQSITQAARSAIEKSNILDEERKRDQNRRRPVAHPPGKNR